MVNSADMSNESPIFHSKSILEEVDSTMRKMSGLLKKLNEQISELPSLKGLHGPYLERAKRLYEEKYKTCREISSLLKELNNYRAHLKEEASRCQKNIGQINRDQVSLHQDQAKDKYIFSKLALEFQYKKVIQRQKELDDIISWAEKALNLAGAKKIPPELKKKKNKFPIPPPGVVPPWEVKSLPPPLEPLSFSGPVSRVTGPVSNYTGNAEISSLMSIGPIGKNFSKKAF